jgi:hypothetical protein
MAAATIEITEYGYRAHTGTDATDITASKVAVQRFIFFPAANDGTCTIKNGRGSTVMVIKGPTAGLANTIEFGGKYLDGINVTHSGAGILLILVQ